MPVLRSKSQIFPQNRISPPCNTLFNIVFVLKSILPKRLYFKLCYKICSLLFEISVILVVVNEILITENDRLFLSVFEKTGSQIICVSDIKCCCSNWVLLRCQMKHEQFSAALWVLPNASAGSTLLWPCLYLKEHSFKNSSHLGETLQWDKMYTVRALKLVNGCLVVTIIF